MRLERCELGTPADMVAQVRALAPQLPSVAASVAEIIDAVGAEGDAAVRRYTERFDADPAPALRVDAEELAHALAGLDPVGPGGPRGRDRQRRGGRLGRRGSRIAS